MEFQKIIVGNLIKDYTIYSYLKEQKYSENLCKKLRKKMGYIKLNGGICFINAKIKQGDVIEICCSPSPKTCITSCIIPLDVVYEDNEVLIVNKPANLATMPSRSHFDHNLSGAILNYMEQKQKDFTVRIINRLDKEACGLVIVAKNAIVCSLLQKNNYITKHYHILCKGKIEKPLCINTNIQTQTITKGYNSQKRVVSKTAGKSAKTYVTPINIFDDISLCEITLENGRTHQIRVHLSSIDHALLGDNIYGDKSNLINHAALLCKKIEFINPITQKQIVAQVDYPNDFKKIIENN